MTSTLLLLLLGVGATLVGEGVAAPLVTAPWGQLAGLDWTTATGGRYYAYLAVPFARPPVGPLRFQKPQPHPGSSSIHNASTFGHSCMQYSPLSGLADMTDLSEDCLTLNVFVPTDQTSKPASGWAVMVWIHGGGYQLGSAKGYDPQRLVVDNGVIVVTVQYRLGVFGFISTGDSLLPGNNGLWDQRLGIKWVKDNIASFGGNPNLITIFGESAGSGSVTSQMLSPTTAGLFQRVIAQSGSASAFWSNSASALSDASSFAVGLGCLSSKEAYSRERDAMLACLQRKEARAMSEFTATMPTALWAPALDGEFFTQNPRLALRDSAFLSSIGFFDRDLMMGLNNNEGLLMTGSLNPNDMRNLSVYRSFYGNYLTTMYGNFSPDILDLLEYEYTYPRNAQTPNTIDLQGFLDTAREMFFTASIVEYMRAHARKPPGSGRSFLYLFEHNLSNAPYPGMGHGQDTLMLFPSTSHSDNDKFAPLLSLTADFDSTDLAVARTFAAFLADFAKTGNPNPGLAGNLATSWTEFDAVNESYLALSASSAMRQHVYAKRSALFLDVMPRMQERWLQLQRPGCTAPPQTTRLEKFDLDVSQAETLIIGLIAAAGVFFLLLCAATYSACSQKSVARQAKYKA